MNRLIPVLLTIVLSICASASMYAQRSQRNAKTVKQEQKELTHQIKQTQADIEQNRKNTLNQINQLNSLNSFIEHTSANIAIINNTIVQLAAEERRLTDSITIISGQVDVLKKQCAKSLRDARKRRQSMSAMSMVFSADNFLQAMKRLSYIKQLNKLAAQRQRQLAESLRRLSSHREALAKVKDQQTQMSLALARENESLKQKQKETQSIITQLQGEATTLASVLSEQQRKAQALDAELNRIIAEEARLAEERRRAEEARLAEEKRRAEEAKRAEEKRLAEQAKRDAENKKSQTAANNKSAANDAPSAKPATKPSTKPATKPTVPEKPKQLSGSFAQNKGSLLFPVSGRYNIVSTFGVNTYKDLPGVKTENSGIDIEATPGSNARATYEGVVSSVFYLDGYHNIVMVRHGEYLTVYANIETLAVKKGDNVKTGQQIGKIYSDPSDNNRTVLHFEIRRETQKLNPLEWVKR